MRMMKLKTTLTANPPGCRCGCGRFKTIAKGSTAILSYRFKDVDYALDYDGDGNPDFKQLTLLLRQPNGSDLA